jgi:hypothetical protein
VDGGEEEPRSRGRGVEPVETPLEDGLDVAIGPGADGSGPRTGRFQAGLAVALGESEDPEARAVVLILPPRERRSPDKGTMEGSGEKRPGVMARCLLTRGPGSPEPPEAREQTVPVSKRTALKVQEKVAPRRAGIRATSRSRSSVETPRGGG